MIAQSFANAVSTNDINYILLKRRDENGEMPTLHPRDQFTIFAMLDKFLGGDGFLSEKSMCWEVDYSTEPITDEQKFEEMLVPVNPMDENRREKWTLIVFSETFFSDKALDDSEVEKFLRLCGLLTAKYQNAIISVNFLHKYEGKSATYSRRAPISKDFISGRGNPALERNKSSENRFSNCSTIFWNGVPISCYRKTTYKEEADNLVSDGYGYDFGDWKSYPTPELRTASDDHKEIARLFNSGSRQIIVSRTCYDMNCTPKLSRQIKLLILTADDSPKVVTWKDKTPNAIVCISDSTKGGGVMIYNAEHNATHINVSSFVFKELFCILYAFYGDAIYEEVDVGCCC